MVVGGPIVTCSHAGAANGGSGGGGGAGGYQIQLEFLQETVDQE